MAASKYKTPILIAADEIEGLEIFPVEPPPLPEAEWRDLEKEFRNYIRLADLTADAEAMFEVVLETMTDRHFYRAALLAQRGGSIRVEYAVGENIDTPAEYDLSENLSDPPTKKIATFQAEQMTRSPYSCKSYALAPLDIRQLDYPVVLYADAGEQKALKLSQRILFREVAELLNERLREVPGGIPKKN